MPPSALFTSHRSFTAFLVYLVLLLDNVLLTVIVPILPDYLAALASRPQSAHSIGQIIPQRFLNASIELHYVPRALQRPGPRLSDENGAIGILLATKAIVQLIVTPFVGNFGQRIGYRSLILFGTGCLWVSSIVFAMGDTYAVLLVARALQGVASSCIGVCGMSLIARLYPQHEQRSRVMGAILGSVALGVLLGYPFGGIVYDWAGKAMPFWLLSIMIALCFGLQACTMNEASGDDCGATDCTQPPANPSSDYLRCLRLLRCRTVRMVIAAIWLSTSAMAILEPCLPIWLMENLHPKRWQIGTVFIPDSVGYFVGTNFFAAWSLRVGQLRVAIGCLFLVACSCFAIPNTSSVLGLLLPHFMLGLGIGCLDAALVPMLATLVDEQHSDAANANFNEGTGSMDTDRASSEAGSANYGIVYAVQQMAVSLAYAMAPMLGGEIAQFCSFAWLMAMVGTANAAYAVVMVVLLMRRANRMDGDGETIEFNDVVRNDDYSRFYNSMAIVDK